MLYKISSIDLTRIAKGTDLELVYYKDDKRRIFRL